MGFGVKVRLPLASMAGMTANSASLSVETWNWRTCWPDSLAGPKLMPVAQLLAVVCPAGPPVARFSSLAD